MPRKPNRIEIRESDALMFLNGKSGATALISIADIEAVLKVSWSLGAKGYVMGALPGGKVVYLHRYLMGFSDKKNVIDHENLNKLDNRRNNLRCVPASHNIFNTRRWGADVGVQLHATTGRGKGIPRKKPWQARIQHEGKFHSLGYYETYEEALAARKTAELSFFEKNKPGAI